MTDMSDERDYRLVAVVRDACIRAALEGYENAGISGLCHEGRWEAAVGEMRRLDLDRLIRERENTTPKT
ncbi:hypothetical protein [Marinobacterium aestuariivivens]|uniref:Acetyltransferase n=1 Tax=Marinobacterium aestuariivivens TaxID=1698799 RepID=A0ABW2A9U0_9GAMM